MLVTVPLAPREYDVWLSWPSGHGATVDPLRDALLRDATPEEVAHRDTWLDGEATGWLALRIGGDLAALQRAAEDRARALLASALDAVPPEARDALRALLDRPTPIAMTPLGAAIVTAVCRELREARRGAKPPAQLPTTGLLARRTVRVTGHVDLHDVALDGARAGDPTREDLAVLRDALRAAPKSWARWCNVLTLHGAWEREQVACLRGVVEALPEPTRARVGAWLALPDFFGSPASRALRGSTILRRPPTLEVTGRSIERAR